MAIAQNFRKHPEAMALQMVLPFGRLLVWALPRPTTRALRAIRTARGAAFKVAGRVAYPEKKTTPQWARDAAKDSRALGLRVKALCMGLIYCP